VLSGLSVLGDTSLELSNTTGDDEDSAIGLKKGGTKEQSKHLGRAKVEAKERQENEPGKYQ